MSSQLFTLPPSFKGSARLFPLSDLVMFPSNLMPLHIFESRYREMLEDAVHGDQLIAMATLLPGFEHEYYSRAPIAPIVCIGRVTDFEKTASGTYNLLLLGLKRASIESEIEPVRSFRRAKVKLLDDPPVQTGEAVRKLGLQLAGRLRRVFPAAETLVEQFQHGEISLGSLTDVIAFHFPLATELKLELLAEANHLVRAERLLANLPKSDLADRGNNLFRAEFSEN